MLRNVKWHEWALLPAAAYAAFRTPWLSAAVAVFVVCITAYAADCAMRRRGPIWNSDEVNSLHAALDILRELVGESRLPGIMLAAMLYAGAHLLVRMLSAVGAGAAAFDLWIWGVQ